MLRKLSILIFSLALFTGCVKDEFEPSNHEQSAIDLCQSLERYSVSVLRPNIDYQNLKKEYLNSVKNTMSAENFYKLTKIFLLNFSDPHIWLHSPFEKTYSLDNLGYTRNISFNTVRTNYLDNITEHTESIISGTIQDSLGYIYIADFNGENEIIEEIFEDIINGFSEKKGLIIDLRENNGGSAYNAQSLLNKLTTQTTLWHTTENRTEYGFDEKHNWYISPRGDSQFIKDVVVLTGRYTVSAGERFVIGAKILPKVKTIGDTTANTQGSIMGREMLNGWTYTFTFERVTSPDGMNYEGIGIDPDIYFQSDILDLSTSDVILEEAISELQ